LFHIEFNKTSENLNDTLKSTNELFDLEESLGKVTTVLNLISPQQPKENPPENHQLENSPTFSTSESYTAVRKRKL
jgi:hypothetical protein